MAGMVKIHPGALLPGRWCLCRHVSNITGKITFEILSQLNSSWTRLRKQLWSFYLESIWTATGSMSSELESAPPHNTHTHLPPRAVLQCVWWQPSHCPECRTFNTETRIIPGEPGQSVTRTAYCSLRKKLVGMWSWKLDLAAHCWELQGQTGMSKGHRKRPGFLPVSCFRWFRRTAAIYPFSYIKHTFIINCLGLCVCLFIVLV